MENNTNNSVNDEEDYENEDWYKELMENEDCTEDETEPDGQKQT